MKGQARWQYASVIHNHDIARLKKIDEVCHMLVFD
jgi:hypothetical protein